MNHCDKKTIYLQRRKLALKSIIVGAFSGLLAVAFRIGLEKAEHVRAIVFKLMRDYHAVAPSLLFAVCMAAILIGLRKWAPEASGSGIPHLKGVLHNGFKLRALPVILVKFFGGIIGIGSGLALGREGPTVQMGAATGALCSNVFKSDENERRLLLCAGAGSGLAAAFNAPLAGLMFIIEELHLKLDRFSLTVAFCSNISANLVCRMLLGQSPIYRLKTLYYPDMKLILWCVLFGVVIGLVGLGFNLCLIKSIKLFGRIKFGLGIALGVLFGFSGFYYPEILGSGHQLTDLVFTGLIPAKILLVYLIARFLLTILSYNTGAPGGIFAPILLLGCITGAIFHHFVNMVHPGTFHLIIFLVLGMVGMFSAVVRGPVTGIILILEMTNEFLLLLPLMVVAIVAYAVPEFFKNKPIYDELLQLDLEKRFGKES